VNARAGEDDEETTATLRSSAAHIFVTALDLDTDGPIPLDEDVEHHLVRVLRLRDGETVSVSDGAGRWRRSVMVVERDSVCLETVGEVVEVQRQHSALTLATAIPKGDRFEWLVQKATELGVSRLQLLHADRSVVRWEAERFVQQLPRLQRISDEAARQSRRVWKVEISPPVAAEAVLPNAVVAEPGGRAVSPNDSVIAIGPEGGWTSAELAVARDRIDLGQNILRTETAGLAAIALCMATRH
jgi:16S rRNA (uracil1498-N3)-methyltransferase